MTITEQVQTSATISLLFDTYITDPCTAAHSQRVSRMCADIARKLGMDETQVEILQRGALLHDIGKAGIQKKILTKPGPLTTKEFISIKHHPEIGYKILEPIEFLSESLPIVRHHHERYDGGGYPDGLKNSEIPFGAAFITVVDAYDALTHDRPYRQKHCHQIAAKTIEKGIGTQFAPHLAQEILSAITTIQMGN